ncbi:MAG TPA: sugar ABC transporter substrate-binding protein [Chloroflexota bacterium]|nr:sugar ABC transporter substrate-binding protein [Chloroflexota bacterium]
MKRRALVLSSVTLPVLAACGGAAETNTPKRAAGERITLRHTPWPGAPSRPAQTAVVEDWNKSHPDVQIVEEVQPGEGSLYQKLLIQAAADQLPDLSFMQGSNDYVSFVGKGLLLPIEEQIKKDRGFNARERLQARSKDVVEMLGHTWGLPVEAGTYVTFYNKNHFLEAGVPEPKRGWTWAELLDASRKLTRQGEAPRFGYGQGIAIGRLEPWIVQNDVRLLDKVAFPTKAQIDAPAVVEALQFVHDLVWKHRVMPTAQMQASATQQAVGLWQGDQSIRQEGIWLTPDLSKNMKAPWGMAPAPKGKREVSQIQINVNVAFKATKHPADCFEFLKFINNEGQKHMIELWGRMPVNLSEGNKQTFIQYLKKTGIDDWQIAWESWERGYSQHLTPAWPDLEREVFTPALNALFGPNGASANVGTVLKELAPKAQQLLTTLGAPPKV